MKHTLKVGITSLVIAAVTMSGIALAQTDETTDQVNQNAVTRIAEKLQSLVDAGTITADQAGAVAETLAEGFRPGGGPGGGQHRPNPGAIAEFLGMETDAFRAALQEFDTLADLAAANGSSGAAVIDYLVGEAEDHLAEAVADGKFDQAEADEKLAQATERITEMVNSDIPDNAGQGRPDGRRGPGGPGADGGEGAFGGQPIFEGQGVSA